MRRVKETQREREREGDLGACIYVHYDSRQSEPMTFDKETSETPVISVFLFRVAHYRHRQALLFRLQRGFRLGSIVSLSPEAESLYAHLPRSIFEGDNEGQRHS